GTTQKDLALDAKTTLEEENLALKQQIEKAKDDKKRDKVLLQGQLKKADRKNRQLTSNISELEESLSRLQRNTRARTRRIGSTSRQFAADQITSRGAKHATRWPSSRTHRQARNCSVRTGDHSRHVQDRKSTRLNSSHVSISYAVFCLKKKKTHY